MYHFPANLAWKHLARGRSVDDAVTITVATAGRAVTFSGLIVSIGLLGLTFFRINLIHSVGYGGILVVVLAVLAAITLLPAALAIIGTRINAFPVAPIRLANAAAQLAYGSGKTKGGRIPKFRKRERATNVGTAYATSESVEHHGFWYQLSHIVMRYPVRVFVPVFVLLVTLGLPS